MKKASLIETLCMGCFFLAAYEAFLNHDKVVW